MPLSHWVQYSIKSCLYTQEDPVLPFVKHSLEIMELRKMEITAPMLFKFLFFCIYFPWHLKYTIIHCLGNKNTTTFLYSWTDVCFEISSGWEEKEKKPRLISFFTFLLSCFSPLGAAGRNRAISIVRENTFWETSQFSTVFQQDPREETLVRSGIMSWNQTGGRKTQQSLRWKISYFWLVLKSSFLNEFVHACVTQAQKS